MRITDKYTLESWRTGELRVYRIPKSILRATVEEFIGTPFSEGHANLNVVEQLFFFLFKQQKWRVIRLPMNATSAVQRYFLPILDDYGIDRSAVFGPGNPDFWLSKPCTSMHTFVEVKFSEKVLSSAQQRWCEDFGYDLQIAKLAPVGLDDREITAANRIIRDRSSPKRATPNL